MIIDDHALFNDGLAHIISQSTSFQVVKQVYESKNALYSYQMYRPDLILVDYNMPETDGLEVVRQLKALNASCKIVVISMYADKKEIQRFMAAGVNGYITKTTPYQQLIEALQAVMMGKNVFPDHIQSKNLPKNDSFQLKIQLTKREVEILRWVEKGLSTGEIADKLTLSYYTVETHRKNINAKLKDLSRMDYQQFVDQLGISS
ncbi:DNA-binding response regulator [Dyadobacter frigoris]|nr:DNA-binding response regulator [Dyadobacter frigoris]